MVEALGRYNSLVLPNIGKYSLNKNTLETLIKLSDWRKPHNCRVMRSVWVLFILSAYTRPIYPTHFAGNLYIAYIKATITSI